MVTTANHKVNFYMILQRRRFDKNLRRFCILKDGFFTIYLGLGGLISGNS